MRRATIVAGVTAGLLGAGGAGVAGAATLPITISFTQGTTTVGTFPVAIAASGAMPATLTGTIDTTTLAAAFPAASVVLPDATLANVDFGLLYGTGQLVVDPVPGDVTGAANAQSGSLDLTGLVAYRLTATTALGTYTCVSDTPVPLQLRGTLNAATGAYAVSGGQISLTLRAETPTDLEARAFCASQAQKVSPGAPVNSAFSGTLTVPNVIPLPPGGTVPAPATPAPVAPAVPQATRVGRLTVAVSRPRTVRRGRSTVATIVVRNTGRAAAASVRVTVAATGRGVSPRSTSKSWASIAAGRSRTVSVRLRTTRTATTRSAVRVAVRGAGGLRASRATTLRLR